MNVHPSHTVITTIDDYTRVTRHYCLVCHQHQVLTEWPRFLPLAKPCPGDTPVTVSPSASRPCPDGGVAPPEASVSPVSPPS